MQLQNKVIWVTGASSGIGKALVQELNKKGVKMIISARNEDALYVVRKSCEIPENIFVLPIDLIKPASFSEKVTQAISHFGRVDSIVHNSGISQRSLAKDTLLKVDDMLFKVNYFGTVGLTKAILPYFIQNNKGNIVVTTSVVGKIGTPLRSSYAASKHALHGFFDSLRAEIYKHNISVNLICPGYVTTNVSKNALTGDGTRQNTMDTATQNGMTAQNFAKQMIRAMEKEKQETYIGGFKEKLGIYTKLFFPRLFAIMIRKLNVT